MTEIPFMEFDEVKLNHKKHNTLFNFCRLKCIILKRDTLPTWFDVRSSAQAFVMTAIWPDIRDFAQ